jgi:hypothetical protein
MPHAARGILTLIVGFVFLEAMLVVSVVIECPSFEP